jgi:hypothetical protein
VVFKLSSSLIDADSSSLIDADYSSSAEEGIMSQLNGSLLPLLSMSSFEEFFADANWMLSGTSYYFTS